jgi:hypothetical protein
MRKLAACFVVVLILGAFAMAQQEQAPFQIPKTELFGGYAYEHADISGSTGPTLGNVAQSSTGLSGFTIEFSHYFSHFLPGSLGYTLEISRVSNSAVDGTGISYVRSTFLAGPSYRLHQFGFLSPSIHALAGVDHATFNVPIDFTTLAVTDTDVAVAGGGALDGNLSQHLAIRLAEVDYVYTHHYGVVQSSFRYAGGIVLRF